MLLTISVAAYNVEKYIKRNIESFLDERCKGRLEVIVIDDESSDNTYSLAKKYEEKWSEIVRVITKKNGGLGSTLNVGINEARGRYFKQVDGDDWVNTEELCGFLDYLETAEADIVFSDFRMCYENGKEEVVMNFSGITPFHMYISEYPALTDICMHNLSTKTRLLKKNNVVLSENCFYVDCELVLFSLAYAKSFVYCPFEVYQYRLGLKDQSVAINSMVKNRDMLMKVTHRMVDFWKENKAGFSLAEIMQMFLVKYLCITTFLVLMSVKKNNEILMQYDKYILDSSKYLYKGMNSNIFISLVRNTKFVGTAIIRMMYILKRKIFD